MRAGAGVGWVVDPPPPTLPLRYSNKPTPTARKSALAAISAFPNETSLEEIARRLHVLEAIRAGEEDIAAGGVVPHEDVVAELEKWLER